MGNYVRITAASIDLIDVLAGVSSGPVENGGIVALVLPILSGVFKTPDSVKSTSKREVYIADFWPTKSVIPVALVEVIAVPHKFDKRAFA
jgi:hypothetical protein